MIQISLMLKTMAVAVLLSTALVSATRTTVVDGSSPQKMRNLGLGNRAGRKGRFLKSSKSSKKKKSEEPSAAPSDDPSSSPSVAPSDDPSSSPSTATSATSTKFRARATQLNNVERAWYVQELELYTDERCTGTRITSGEPLHSSDVVRPKRYDAFDDDITTIWEGGNDEGGFTWIGLDFDTPTNIRCVRLREEPLSYIATEVVIEEWTPIPGFSRWKPVNGMSPQTKLESQTVTTYELFADNIFG